MKTRVQTGWYHNPQWMQIGINFLKIKVQNPQRD